MALYTFRCNCLTLLYFRGLKCRIGAFTDGNKSSADYTCWSMCIARSTLYWWYSVTRRTIAIC